MESGAISGRILTLTLDKLAELACEAGLEARLVQDRESEESDEVRDGPFTDEDFLSLPERHWALRVWNVEKYAPVLAVLLESFRFIPDWRFVARLSVVVLTGRCTESGIRCGFGWERIYAAAAA
jgi:ribosomal protein L16 Arg81 hydroxylase